MSQAQSFYGIKSWPDEMGTLSALPLKAGVSRGVGPLGEGKPSEPIGGVPEFEDQLNSSRASFCFVRNGESNASRDAKRVCCS